ncbi:hypothetical protein Q9233_006680, partial [Columba guinea]
LLKHYPPLTRRSSPAEYAAPDWYLHCSSPPATDKPRPAQRTSEAVNFSKLISNGYGTDWLQQRTGREKKIPETSENIEQSK